MKLPLLRIVEWIEKNRVRLFFSSGKVMEVAIPWVRSAKHAKIVDDGMGFDAGDGKDVGADTLAMMRGKVLLPGDRGWVGSPTTRRHKRAA
jgi:hypothetical protein